MLFGLTYGAMSIDITSNIKVFDYRKQIDQKDIKQ